MTTTTATCEAYVGKAAGAFGFEPVTCSQTIGLTTLIDAAGITHHACSRWGHRASLVRRFGETILPEEPPEPEWTMPAVECASCIDNAAAGWGPSHVASPRCESGQRPHCTCDVCF